MEPEPHMLKIPNRIGLPESEYSGIDSLEECHDRKHFLNYSKKISYRYNSRGFRDHEWPQDLSEVIWCVGDSFTVGLGQPFEETWPQLLEKKLGRRCLNVGEDGCSNDTLSMRIQEISRLYKPKHIIVMWSYLSRRRVNNVNVHHDKKSFGFKEDVTNFVKNYAIVNQLPNIVNLIVPNATTRPDTLNKFLKKLLNKEKNNYPKLLNFQVIDLARDGLHFDVNTSTNITKLICENMECVDK